MIRLLSIDQMFCRLTVLVKKLMIVLTDLKQSRQNDVLKRDPGTKIKVNQRGTGVTSTDFNSQEILESYIIVLSSKMY